MVFRILYNPFHVPPQNILLEPILAPDTHGLGNEIDIIGDTEIVARLFSYKNLIAVVANSNQPLRSGLGSILQAFFTNPGTAFREPADSPAAAAHRLPAVMLHLLERHPGHLL